MRVFKTRGYIIAVARSQLFIRAPAASHKTLLLQHRKGVFDCSQMHCAAADHVGLHAGAQCIHIAVRMLTGKNVLVTREWFEVGLVIQVINGHLPVAIACASLVGQKQVLGHRVRLVPRP